MRDEGSGISGKGCLRNQDAEIRKQRKDQASTELNPVS
jgi:hypothetical protein